MLSPHSRLSVVVPARVEQAPPGVPVPNRTGRARRGDPDVYEAESGEIVRVAGVAPRCTFVRYEHDMGGDFAVVIGGKHGHRLERCVFVDRVKPLRKRRAARVRSDVAT